MSAAEILIVLAVGSVASIIKSTTGMGYPLILLPVLALFMDVSEAVALVAVPNFVLNAKLVWSLRSSRRESTTLIGFLSGGVVGAVIGTLLLSVLSDDVLRVMLIVVIVAFLANRLRTQNPSLSPRVAHALGPFVGVSAGVFQGAAGISGPIVSPWFLSTGLSRDGYIFSVATVFSMIGLAQIIVLGAQERLGGDSTVVSLLLIPLAFALFPFGRKLRERVSLAMFEYAILVLLAASALSLAIKLV